MALSTGPGSSAAAQGRDKVFELKFSHWVPPNHPLQKALEDWGAAVEKASGGTLKYNVFPPQQLGKAFDHYDMARDGIADLTYVNPGYQPGRFPIIAAGELPFLISDAKGGSEALDASLSLRKRPRTPTLSRKPGGREEASLQLSCALGEGRLRLRSGMRECSEPG
jgi:TRAP-type C4-dicarboxylate transport system substrate-binding protein